MQHGLLRVPGTATQVLSDFLLAGASGKGEFRSLRFLHFGTSVHTSDTRGGFTIGLRKIIFCVLRKFFVSYSPPLVRKDFRGQREILGKKIKKTLL